VLNLSQFTGGQHQSGLLELNFGRDGMAMNIGTGGANVSFGNIASAMRGLQVWGVNSHISSFGRQNNLTDLITLRLQYGYGSEAQVGQLWEILMGDTLLNFNANGGDLGAQTTNINGQRIINLFGYQQGMSREEQFRLATILGHEAYRDGFGVGQVDAFGNVVTAESNFAELQLASIARLAMGARIHADHNWFYNYNPDFDLENLFFLYAIQTGDFSLFNAYLELNYLNDEDYFFLRTMTMGDFQNMVDSRYANIPLFNARLPDEVERINDERREAAFQRYRANYMEENLHLAISRDDFMQNEALLEKHGFLRMNFISLHGYGCRFFATKYMLESITGKYFSAIDLHNFVFANRLFSDRSNLSSENMAAIMTRNSDGDFFVTVDPSTGKPSTEVLYSLHNSPHMYLATLMVSNGIGGEHFVTLDRIVFAYDAGNPVISEIHVSNPWTSTNPDTVIGKQIYTFNEILRWDIFKVTWNPKDILLIGN
jgi:hypothetical protein